MKSNDKTFQERRKCQLVLKKNEKEKKRFKRKEKKNLIF